MSEHERKILRHSLAQKSMANLYSKFQHRYAWYFVLAVVGPFALFALPSIYYVRENYDIFVRLAYDVRPELLQHLERESTLLMGLFGFAMLASTLFCYWLTFKLMGLIAGPVWALEKHMKQVTLGDWSSQDFQTRSNDEFQSLVGTYSYLYRSLRVNTQRELEALESIGLDPRDRHTYNILKNLIEMKRAQLGVQIQEFNAEVSEETSSSPSKRLAS